MNRMNPFMIIFAALVVFGILTQFASNPFGLLIPLLVFGAIFYLMRFPRGSRNWWPFQKKNPSPRNKKKNNFKVFTNRDFREDDDDQRPNRFH